jgi:hypothetical protein
MTDLAKTLRDEGGLDESERFIDVSFASAKGGNDEIGPTKCSNRWKIHDIADHRGLPAEIVQSQIST